MSEAHRHLQHTCNVIVFVRVCSVFTVLFAYCAYTSQRGNALPTAGKSGVCRSLCGEMFDARLYDKIAHNSGDWSARLKLTVNSVNRFVSHLFVLKF